AVRRILAGMPARLLEAGSVSEALRTVQEYRPHVVVLDLGLPDAGGEEVLSALRADPRTRDVPVLVFTSKQMRAADRARLSEATGIFSKGGDDADRLRTTLVSLWNEVEADR
ncbi:MAG TPA: response regulator, partial [Candidatus Polarisedimenticolaceae bacterium]|nr:response regulator [Candidatus Polarisedimenticolaceae bacterium]